MYRLLLMTISDANLIPEATCPGSGSPDVPNKDLVACEMSLAIDLTNVEESDVYVISSIFCFIYSYYYSGSTFFKLCY